ncbi:MAG: histidine phosphatase family protein [SAR202 cluster bacterium]|nr:histidine phosphatase family protein [SAR202 cluster bacterium]
MRLVLVRHGESVWNRDGRFQGQCAAELSSLGLEQAQDVAAAFKNLCPNVLHSSPLKRTMQMAQAISEACGLPIMKEDGLQEMNLGHIDGLTGVELKEQYPELYKQWREDPSRVAMPGGESLGELQERAWRAIETIRRAGADLGSDGLAAVVCHNFAIITIMCRLLGMPLSNFHRIRIALGSLNTIEWDDRGWRLLGLNEVYHLRSGRTYGS